MERSRRTSSSRSTVAPPALVFPSLYEGFGQPPLEAMACGCPVAARTPPRCRRCAATLRGSSTRARRRRSPRRSTTSWRPRRVAPPGSARAASFTWEATAARTRGRLPRSSRLTVERRELGVDEQLDEAPRSCTDGSQPSADRAREASPTRSWSSAGRGGASRPGADVLAPVEPDGARRRSRRAPRRSASRPSRRRSRRLVLLQHQPHRAHVVGGVPPVAPGRRGRRAQSSLSCRARWPPPRARPCGAGSRAAGAATRGCRGSAAREHAVAAPVAVRDEVAVRLRDAVGGHRVQRRLLRLRRLAGSPKISLEDAW